MGRDEFGIPPSSERNLDGEEAAFDMEKRGARSALWQRRRCSGNAVIIVRFVSTKNI